MGQTLSEPVTEKHTTVVWRDKKFWVGLSDMQGWRISMEDSHSIHLFLPPTSVSRPPEEAKAPADEIQEQPAGSTVTNNSLGIDGPAFFGVFDGHGGSTVAKFAGTTLHSRLADLPAYNDGKYEEALKEAFLKTDEDLRADPTFLNDPSGCTAVVGVVTGDGRVIVANAGDSRSVLSNKGEAKAMSNDHKPTNKEETARITAAGGFVEFGRVNGNLALSRAIGDFEFKKNLTLEPEKQIVSVDPEIITHTADGEEEFLILACDGIWDCLSSQQAIDFTRRAVANGDDLGKICEDMMVKCLAKDSETGGIGCDNMTVVIVAFLNGRSIDEWRDWVKDRVNRKIGYDTPESIPDVFAQAAQQSSLGGITGMGGPGGFRIAGAGGLANIASILGASGITFKPVDDSDSEDDDDDMRVEPDEPQSGKIQELSEEPEVTSTSASESKGKGKEMADGFLDQKALDKDLKPVDVTNDYAKAAQSKADEAMYAQSNRGSVELVDEDSVMASDEESEETTTGAPSPSAHPHDSISSGPEPYPLPRPDDDKSRPPSFRSIGSPEVPTHEELRSEPGGDEAPAVSRVEGLMDTSENPVKM